MSNDLSDLPWEVWEKIRCLSLELAEGDITQKGYEKKKNAILKQYQTSTYTTTQSTHPAVSVPAQLPEPVLIPVQNTLQPPKIDTRLLSLDTLEPSAADIVDILDCLPSPSHTSEQPFFTKKNPEQPESPSNTTPVQPITYPPPHSLDNSVPEQFPHKFREQHSVPHSPDAIIPYAFSAATERINQSYPISHRNSPILTHQSSLSLSSRANGLPDYRSYSPHPTRYSAASSVESQFTSRRSLALSKKSFSTKRSRYDNSTMASNFKAIEPAPQVTLSFEDPFERWKLAELSGRQLFPIESPLNLPTDPLISLIEIIRQRSNTDIGNLVAFVSVDMKGKEVGDITWSKLDKRATDIASQLQSVGNVGDCVGLVYRRVEILEFIVAFIGCFYAGRIAVPINATESLSELAFVLQLTKAERVLTTDQNAKAFLKDIQTSQTPFPKVVWQRTDEAAGWSGRQKQTTPTDLPKDAYIEYAKAANGELKGVTVSHNTVLDQCKILDAALGYKERTCVVSFWEPRQQIGLISSIFWSVYGGHHMIFADQNILESPPVWIHVLSRYKAALAMTDYRSLLDITYFYSAYPKQVEQYNKRVKPDLSSLSCILVDTVVVRPGWHDQITEQLLRPLAADNNITAIICPVASLPEHGGIILSIRETQTAPRQYSKTDTEEENKEEKIEVQEYLLETESLWNNKVVVLAAGVQARQSASISTHYTAYVGSFGYVVPKATVAIVDPDTTLLCPGDTLGEIWIHGPALPDGFFALPRHTEAIFNAKPLAVSSETLVPELYQQTFLRTGLVGALIDGQLVILGTYEDRVRQQRRNDRLGVDRIYFSSRLVDTISQNTPVEQCVVFEILVHGQHMPVVAFESPSIPSDLPQLAESVHSALINYDSLRPFAIVILAPDALPRHRKHGRRQIHALMTKRLFLSGTMTIRYIKLDIDRTLLPLLTSDETNQEAWFKDLVHQRTIQTGVAPATVYQHTGVPPPTTIIDERSRQDLSSFRSIVDCLIWRARRTPDEITYVAVQGSTSKSYSFRKMSAKIAMVANYLTKQGLRRGQKAIVMVSFGHAWVRTIYACFSIGVIPVPIAPPDPHHYPQRVQQDVKALVDALRILHTNILIVNPPSEDAIKHPSVAAALKSSTMVAGGPPKIERINIQKASKYNTPLGTENGFFVRPEWVNSDRKTPAIILPHRTAEGKLRLMSLSHSTLLHQCSILKTVCRMKAQKNIVVTGMKIGGPNLLQAAFCGIYSGSITVLISLPDFYSSPAHFLELLNRYKVKDVIVSQELIQYVMQRATNHTQKIPLSSIENLLVTSDERPKSTLYQQMTRFFTRNQLQRNSIQTSYSHLGNSMIASTSYDLAHPTPPLIIDIEKLRQGVVRCVLPEEGSIGIEVYTSGTVSINTTVAIVHPTYRTLCPGNHLGEIWVSSDANILSEWGLSEQDHATRFEATLIGGPDPAVKYMRTGDIGFLWSWPNSTFPGRDGDQWLYVLGSMEDTIERHGLIHFCVDLERTIQQSHPDIPEESSIVFQDSEDIVAVIAVKFKPHALAAVPLVVNAVLESHTLLIDIVVVVDITQLPRERHGEKQRQKAKIAYTTKRLQPLYVKRITHPRSLSSSSSYSSIPSWSRPSSFSAPKHKQSSLHQTVHNYSRSDCYNPLGRQGTDSSRNSFQTVTTTSTMHTNKSAIS